MNEIETMTVGDLMDSLKVYPKDMDVEIVINNFSSNRHLIMATDFKPPTNDGRVRIGAYIVAKEDYQRQ